MRCTPGSCNLPVAPGSKGLGARSFKEMSRPLSSRKVRHQRPRAAGDIFKAFSTRSTRPLPLPSITTNEIAITSSHDQIHDYFLDPSRPELCYISLVRQTVAPGRSSQSPLRSRTQGQPRLLKDPSMSSWNSCITHFLQPCV